jgi:phosphate transport system permease protein
METIFKVVIPAAHSGIIAAVILGMMRAVGETMVVWMASGNAAQIPHPWWDISQSVRTITATIAGEMGETPKNTSHYYALFTMGVLLLVLTFCLNIISEYFLARGKKATGKS